MRWRVSRRTLLLIAGLVWIIAGANILRIGIITWWMTNGNGCSKQVKPLSSSCFSSV